MRLTSETRDQRDNREARVQFPDQGFILGIYGINLLFHLVLLRFPPPAFFYNLDELDLTFSCLDRFLGVPSTIMMEPSSVLQMLSVPLFFSDFIIRKGFPLSPTTALDRFSSYLADSYADPRHQVILLRALVAVIACAAPAFLFAICRRLGGSRLTSALCGIAFSVTPSVFGQSLMAAGDAAGISLVLLAVLLATYSTDGRWDKLGATGVSFAAAVAFKLTMASSIVIVLAVLFQDRRCREMGSVLKFSLSVFVGFLLWCPYVWIEPVRLMKAIAGNVGKSGSRPDAAQFLLRLQDSTGIAFAIFVGTVLIAVLWMLPRTSVKGLLIALILSFCVLITPLFLKASTVYPRYFIPVSVPPLLCFVLLTVKSPRIAAPLLGLLAFATTITMVRDQIVIHAPNRLINALQMIPRLPPSGRIYIPEEAVTTYALRLPQPTYLRVSTHAKEVLVQGRGITTFLREHGIHASPIRTLVTDFNEDEQANAAHMAAAAESASNSGSREILLYSVSGSSERTSWADLQLKDAIETLHGPQPVFVLMKSNQATLEKPLWQDSEWAWYTNNGDIPRP